MDSIAIELCERGWFPDVLSRFGMRRLMAKRIADESALHDEQHFRSRIEELRQSRIATDTDAANEQHYELPAEFFVQVLGKHLKYSGCLWDTDVTDLDTAEARMLALSCERAELSNGQRILELGCGWGSLTLWMASHYPDAQITAVSNSASQREYIMGQCDARGLSNVQVITADVNEFKPSGQYDRVVSVEMFEHMKNYAELMKNIHGWLRPGGKLFVHIFCHRELMYPFTTDGENDWMGKYFFTGGLMPAENTLLHFQDHLKIEEQWSLSGTHYEKTSNAWLRNMDDRRDAVMRALTEAYGPDEAARWFQRWRMFFMAVAELFGYDGGSEWRIAHYRFSRPE